MLRQNKVDLVERLVESAKGHITNVRSVVDGDASSKFTEKELEELPEIFLDWCLGDLNEALSVLKSSRWWEE